MDLESRPMKTWFDLGHGTLAERVTGMSIMRLTLIEVNLSK